MSDYDDEKKKREAEAAAAMAAAEERRRQSQTRTGDTQQIVSQGSAIVAGERVATPIVDAPTSTDLKVVLSPEAQAAAEAAEVEQSRGQSSGRARGLTSGALEPDEESAGAEGEDIDADVEDDGGPAERQVDPAVAGTPDEHDQWFDDGDKPVPNVDATDADMNGLVDIRLPPPASPPDAEDKRLAADLHRGNWRRYATVAFLPIALVTLVAVVFWQATIVEQPANLVQLVREGSLDKAQAAVDKAVEGSTFKVQFVASEVLLSDNTVVASMPPDVVVGEVVSVAQTEESAPAVVPLWREAEPEEAVWLENKRMDTLVAESSPPELLSDRIKVPIVSAQAGVLPAATSAPVQVASAKAGVVPTAREVRPHLKRGLTSSTKVKARDSTSGAPTVASAVAPSPPTPTPPVIAPSPPPKPAGLEVGAVYEVYEQEDGSLVFKKVK